MATSGLDASCQDRLLARVLHDRIKAGATLVGGCDAAFATSCSLQISALVKPVVKRNGKLIDVLFDGFRTASCCSIAERLTDWV